MSSEVVWTPPAQVVESSKLTAFGRSVGFAPDDYNALHAWSIGEPGAFWSALWDFAGVIGDKGDIALETDPGAWMTGARFFPSGRINLAENLLRRAGNDIAVIETDEAGAVREFTFDALRGMVARVADGLRGAGVEPGDRVAAVLPNRIESLVTLLATAAVGAVWTSCSPDFGADAITGRLGQVGPKVLFAAPRYRYGGKAHDVGAVIAEVAGQITGLSHVVLVGDHDGIAVPGVATVGYEGFGTSAPLAFNRVNFNDPVFILYTSGTTGAPKAIVHRVGGVVLQHVKEHMLHGDVRPGDRALWYTNTAWMMYHWVVSVLACDATLVLYDGAPILKTDGGLDPSPLWRVVEDRGVTHLGISPKYLATLASIGCRPGDAYDLSSLRWLLSAGAPVAPNQFDWIYDAVKRDMGFASISGGTEILGCFLLGSPNHPVRRGELTVKGLGLAVAVHDARGAGIIGRAGDLVCTEPFPSMPITFWGEGGTERYHGTYFADRPEVWTHGDLAQMTPHGSAIILGRTDNTLKPGGVRIGTSDIYNVCEDFDGVEDCLVFGRPVDGDEEIVLCLRMADGRRLDADHAKSLRTAIRAATSPRHVPAHIYEVEAIPYTLNGKRVEGAVRDIAAGRPVRNRSSLSNPESLDCYATLSSQVSL